MVTRKLLTILIALSAVFALASSSYADISNAAVLFLRIAPGARAAGMGEAFVAIADDATTTHFNPAGLGADPLADVWKEIEVPSHLKPLRATAALKKEGGSGYRAHDIWAITSQGLARYDYRTWHLGEVFSTKTDQTVEKVVKSYFNVSDEDRLARMVEMVAAANNAENPEYLEKLRDSVMASVPEDYSALELLKSAFDSLLTGYQRCLINWEKVREAKKLLADGLKDSVLTEMETDRISFAVEKTRNRFIPEELTIPYATLCGSELTAIATTEEALLVGTSDGLYSFNGRRWQTLTDAEALPSTNILCLFARGGVIYIGTDRGLARFSGLQVASVAGVEQLPEGSVTAIGSKGHDDVWIALDNDLYHWDGQNLSNSFEYTVVLDDTPEKIAEKFAVYGTAAEKDKYLVKFQELNQDLLERVSAAGINEEPADSVQMLPVDSVAAEPEQDPDVDSAAGEIDPEIEQLPDSSDTTLAGQPESGTVEPAAPGGLVPGVVVRAPFLAEIKGKVNAIHASFDKVWLGTEYGVMMFDTEGWVLPGYREHVIQSGETVDDLVQMRTHKDFASSLRYAAVICDINDLGYELGEPLTEGRAIIIPRNPSAASVNSIGGNPQRIYFATSEGLVEYNVTTKLSFFTTFSVSPGLPRRTFPMLGWSRVDQKGMGDANVVDIHLVEDALVFTSDEKMVVKASGCVEISLMYAKWLPELADDLYYGFMSCAVSAGSWGTFGGNITYISYGRFARTTTSPTVIDEFDSFDIAFTASYGTSLSGKLKGGISAKVIYSKLAEIGAGVELGQGTSTGFAVDLGLLYLMNPRLNWGLALTNLGPKMAYIDAAQADDLPRNLAFGFAYSLLQSDYYRLLVAAEVNKIMVGLGDGLGEELKQVTLNGGAEFMYANVIAFRGGYIHDEEGKLKTFTFGVGLCLKNRLKFDFAYYFGSESNESRKGIRPMTVTVII